MKFKVGEAGPEGINKDADREFDRGRVMELERGPMEAFRDDDPDDGRVGGAARTGGC